MVPLPSLGVGSRTGLLRPKIGSRMAGSVGTPARVFFLRSARNGVVEVLSAILDPVHFLILSFSSSSPSFLERCSYGHLPKRRPLVYEAFTLSSRSVSSIAVSASPILSRTQGPLRTSTPSEVPPPSPSSNPFGSVSVLRTFGEDASTDILRLVRVFACYPECTCSSLGH